MSGSSGGKGRMKSRNIFMLVVLLIGGILVGALISSAAHDVHYLSWLAYSLNFGVDTSKPVLIDLSVVKFSLGAEIHISVAQIICLFLAALLYRRIR